MQLRTSLSASSLRASRVPALPCGPRKARRAMAKVFSASAEPQGSTSKTAETKLVGPEPKRFAVPQGQLANIASAAFPFLARAGSGGFVAGYKSGWVPDVPGKYAVARGAGRMVEESSTVLSSFPRPKQPLVIYEFESCPFCRKVREALVILDLDAVYYPCPKEGTTWRPKAIELSGKKQFPFLVDPNTGKSMLESDDIIRYLFDTYGDGNVPLMLRLGYFTTLTCGLGMAPRGTKGGWLKPNKVSKDMEPLKYYGYEASPFCKVVREKLSELEIPHLYVSTARGSPKRQQLLDKRGHFQVPYIEDPNTGIAMFESADIIAYLEKTYGSGST